MKPKLELVTKQGPGGPVRAPEPEPRPPKPKAAGRRAVLHALMGLMSDGVSRTDAQMRDALAAAGTPAHQTTVVDARNLLLKRRILSRSRRVLGMHGHACQSYKLRRLECEELRCEMTHVDESGHSGVGKLVIRTIVRHDKTGDYECTFVDANGRETYAFVRGVRADNGPWWVFGAAVEALNLRKQRRTRACKQRKARQEAVE